eukprot:2039545-Prymnesium_polylepis.1
MAAVRQAVGPAVGVGLDFHGRVKVPTCKRLMAALAPYDPLFFEEPVSAEQNRSLPAMAAATSIPLATGERMFTVAAFRDLLEARCVDILQPDWCGTRVAASRAGPRQRERTRRVPWRALRVARVSLLFARC